MKKRFLIILIIFLIGNISMSAYGNERINQQKIVKLNVYTFILGKALAENIPVEDKLKNVVIWINKNFNEKKYLLVFFENLTLYMQKQLKKETTYTKKEIEQNIKDLVWPRFK